jgi:hypothetical protein
VAVPEVCFPSLRAPYSQGAWPETLGARTGGVMGAFPGTPLSVSKADRGVRDLDARLQKVLVIALFPPGQRRFLTGASEASYVRNFT